MGKKASPGTKRWHHETAVRGEASLGVWWCEVRGRQPGPTVAVIAGQHGMEPAGPAMLAAFLKELDPADVRGTLRAVPLAAAEALRGGYECDVPADVAEAARQRGVPWGGCPFKLSRQTCGRNLNRLWPGKPEGTIHERLAAILWQRVVSNAQYVMDYHCWMDNGPAGVIGYSDASLEWGRWFGIPHLHRYPLTDHPGLLGLYAMNAGKIAVTVELAPQRRITADAAEMGRAGLVNMLRHAGALKGRAVKPGKQYLVEYQPGDARPMPVAWDALVYPKHTPGRWYRKGETIGTAVRLDRPQTVRQLRAPCDGLLMASTAWAMIPKGKSAFTFYRARPF